MPAAVLHPAAVRRPAMVCLQTMRAMDWRTRKVLAWRISNTLEADFRVEALNEAIHRFAPPEIMNAHPIVVCRRPPAGRRGAQVTSVAWTDRLKQAG